MKKYMRRISTGAARGMTLIEIMVVVFILGLIASVVAISVGDTRETAEIGTTRIALSKIAEALELYRLKKGRYPSTAEGLEALRTEKLVKKPPRDGWGRAYVYECPAPSGEGAYGLRSLGPDGQPGGDDIEAD